MRFGYFIKDRIVAMFNLEVVHGKKNAKFYVTLTCIQVEKKWYLFKEWYLYKEIFTKENR